MMFTWPEFSLFNFESFLLRRSVSITLIGPELADVSDMGTSVVVYPGEEDNHDESHPLYFPQTLENYLRQNTGNFWWGDCHLIVISQNRELKVLWCMSPVKCSYTTQMKIPNPSIRTVVSCVALMLTHLG
jgi:hypothetical protein